MLQIKSDFVIQQLSQTKGSGFTYTKWPTLSLLRCAVAMATVSLSSWTRSSVLHIIITHYCSNRDWLLSGQQEFNET